MAKTKTERELLEDQVQTLKSQREPYESDYEEIGRLCVPYRVELKNKSGSRKNNRRSNTTSQDTAATKAVRTLKNGMATGLTSATRPWFNLTTRDPDLREFQPVKEWLEYVKRTLYQFFASTNYYDATKVQYADLGPMGIGAMVAVEHPQYGAVYHHCPVGTYWIGLDSGLRLHTFARTGTRTVIQLFEMANGDRSKLSQRVKTAYDKGDYHERHEVMHIIQRNTDAHGDFLSDIKKPWRSVRWEVEQNDKSILLTDSGYDSQPLSVPRWETVGDEVYCETSPGFEALPDMRELQLAARRRSRAMDNLVKPALQAPAGMARTRLSLDPGTINYVDALSDRQVRPILDLDPRIIGAVREDVQAREERVNELFYADLFNAITDMEGVQPRNEQELLYRHEEKLTQLGPVVDRVNIEKLEVDIERAYTILKNLGQLPPPPPELEDEPLEVEFISMLAQAQKASSASSIERAARFVGFIGGMFPDATIKFDAEQAIDEFADSSGTMPSIIRSDEVVAKMKADIAQKQQQMQALEAAPAMRDGAQAAKLLSETRVDQDGTSMLERVAGQ